MQQAIETSLVPIGKYGYAMVFLGTAVDHGGIPFVAFLAARRRES